MTISEKPTAPVARTLLKQLLDAGWSASLEHGSGTAEFGRLDWVDGKRKRVQAVEPVDSVSVRASHHDGRRFFAVWERRQGTKSWSMCDAWRFKHAGDIAPKQITATQMKGYALAADVPSALAAEAAAAPKAEREASAA